MKSIEITRKIKKYSLISLILPLVALNSCLLLYQTLEKYSLYETYNWDENIKAEFLLKKEQPNILYDDITLTNCPKYVPIKHIRLDANNNQKYVSFTYTDKLEKKCIKNNKILFFILSKFNFLEEMIINGIKLNNSGFALVKNPYLYGEVSISRTARFYPATLIFKPLIIFSGIFLFFYWFNNLRLFKNLSKNGTIENFSKKFLIFGTLSSIFLILHAIFLGLDYNIKGFSQIRKIIIISFIVFEICAQLFLTKVLFENRLNLKSYIRAVIIKIKVIFVSLVLIVTALIMGMLIFGDLSTNLKHIIEWNYFTVLLIYYFLSRLLWR